MTAADDRSGADCVVVPRNLIWADATPMVVMVEVDTRHLRNPFWFQGLGKARRTVGLVPLDGAPDDLSGARLCGSIHHTSRCGSTLLVRQLGAIPGVLALSEPPVFEHLLDHPGADPARAPARLRKLLGLHSRALGPVADSLVIKWSNLGGLYAKVIAEALPESPAIFLHRAPAAIIASLAAELPGALSRLRPDHLVGAAAVTEAGFAALSPLDLAVRVIASSALRVSEVGDVRTALYEALPEAAWLRVAPWFGLETAPETIEQMRGVSQYESKSSNLGRIAAKVQPGSAKFHDDQLGLLAAALENASARLMPL